MPPLSDYFAWLCLFIFINADRFSQGVSMGVKDGFLKPGQNLMIEGEVTNSCYWIQKGELRITIREHGKTKELRKVGPGELLGEMAFFDNQPRSCTVTALTDCQFLTLHREDFEDLINDQPVWIKKIISTLSDRLRTLTGEVEHKKVA